MKQLLKWQIFNQTLKKSDPADVLKDWNFKGYFPLSYKIRGEALAPLHLSNPVLDFNYTQDKCSALRLFPLNSTVKFSCALKCKNVFFLQLLYLIMSTAYVLNCLISVQKFVHFNISLMKTYTYIQQFKNQVHRMEAPIKNHWVHS